jgi:ABC-2 type transport system permease protein
MTNYSIFLKKELFESVKTFKLFIMIAVFAVLAAISPITAKFTPQILKWAFEFDPTLDAAVAAVLANMPEPTALDSWAQFYNNIGQMGFIVLVIVFSGMLASELPRGTTSSGGTLTIILTKGISRTAILLSKATSAALIWTVSFALAFAVCLAGTIFLFPETVAGTLFAAATLWVFGLFLVALTVLCAALTNKNYICMVLVGAVVVVMNIINIVPFVSKYNPVSLVTAGYGVMAEVTQAGEAYPALAVTGICTVLMVIAGLIVFNRKKL